MKTTTVRELRNNYSRVLKWVSAGQEVQVTRRGKVVARVVPPPAGPKPRLDWTRSAAFNRPELPQTLSARQSAAILSQSQGV